MASINDNFSPIDKAVIENYDFSQFRKITQFVLHEDNLLLSVISVFPDIEGLYLGSSEIIEKQKEINNSLFKTNCKFSEGSFYEKFHPKFPLYLIKNLLHTLDNEEVIAFMNKFYPLTEEYTRFIFIEKMKNTESNFTNYERTENEYREIFQKSNFVLTNIINIDNDNSVIEVLRL